MSVPEIAPYLAQTLLWTTIKIGVALLVLAILDYGFQWWKHEQDLRMTPQEVREEMKNLEGDPQIAARREQVQRQLAHEPAVGSRCPRPTWWSPTPPNWPWPSSTIRRRWPRRSWWPRGPACWPSGSASWPWSTASRSSRRSRWPRPSTAKSTSTSPIPHDKYAAVAEVLAYVYQLKGKKIRQPPGTQAA